MSDEWLTVYYAANPLEAQLLKGLLETQQITVRMTDNGMVGGIGELPADAIETPLKVQAEQYEQARKILTNYEQDRQLEITCPHCQETNFSNFEVCWQCGKDLA
ncbi:hypothetical protein C5610_13525 [Idiomarina sp. OT37-5b]|jgi:deoxyxylulose-5-phosphate synthase|uniref:DUF2007 domain-containing protein n=1 Tax=Idiomarina aquatica TaxID=1327752 RepID=A0AA94JF69_9GAMM|nr:MULTISPECIES: DUF2007 domain-containing protein [Idiomarina]AVJ57221.1 hypothetical protein C5610_13525 [Idiomarina sp. OT37-5b]RUO45676.1 hypothetical protein CWE23_06735 [Idiomarina aquatica]